MEMEDRTCLTRIKRPAKERHFVFHPASLALLESSILLKKHISITAKEQWNSKVGRWKGS